MISRVHTALETIDPELGAFITVDAGGALARARHPPSGRAEGLLIAVKDLIDTADLRTTYGSTRYCDHIPRRTAPIVTDLEREGAVVIGKTNLNEFAYGVSGYNPHYGLMRLPQDRSRTPGGSSGGSAIAVAAGAADVGIGTDTSGSIRIPAACCGIFGFCCAARAVPLAGVHPLAPDYDRAGYLTRDVPTLQRILDIRQLPETSGLKVVSAAELQLPALPDEHWTLFREQAHRIHREAAVREPQTYGADLHVKLAQPVGDPVRARETMRAWRAEVDAALHGIDLHVGPVMDGPAPLTTDVLADYRDGTLHASEPLLAHTPTANALGWPALAVPTPDGPRQILGRPGAEPAILALGAEMSRAALPPSPGYQS
ncbi:amidase [Streptomyces antioxidans]|uniref:Amidase n=1 Tax=Streptomyces antioxidans TaxID=1507734 RepID=A0A1V4DBS0_9ACTN|nr:amidase [Streptomyces antioxidans]OPF83718.1 amidase [Streptomyces antioxidans]